MQSTRSPTEFDQNNRDVTSIPGYVIKENRSRGAKHGASERQKMYYQTKQMLRKARQGKHGNHPTILSRWYGEADEGGKNTTLYCTTGSPWRSTSTPLQELKEFKIQNIGFLRQMQKEELSNHSINDPTLLKRKENANDCTTSTWQEPNKTTETFLAVNK